MLKSKANEEHGLELDFDQTNDVIRELNGKNPKPRCQEQVLIGSELR